MVSHFIDCDIVSKYGPEIIPYLNTFHAVIMSGNYDVLMDPSKSVRFMQNGNFQFCWYQKNTKVIYSDLIASTPFWKLWINIGQFYWIFGFSLKRCWLQQNLKGLVHNNHISQTFTYQGIFCPSFMSLAPTQQI